jgi:hypothetical protein
LNPSRLNESKKILFARSLVAPLQQQRVDDRLKSRKVPQTSAAATIKIEGAEQSP